MMLVHMPSEKVIYHLSLKSGHLVPELVDTRQCGVQRGAKMLLLGAHVRQCLLCY